MIAWRVDKLLNDGFPVGSRAFYQSGTRGARHVAPLLRVTSRKANGVPTWPQHVAYTSRTMYTRTPILHSNPDVLIAVFVVNKISLFFPLWKHNPLQSVDTVEVHSATPGILADGCG
jgi:hypothetical protein